MFIKAVLIIFSFTANGAFAGFKGEVVFSKVEVQNHLENIAALTSEAEQCLKQDLNRHQEFYKKYGISAFYGQNSSFSKMTEKEKRDFLISKRLDPNLLNQITGTSCIGLTLKCLERGFKVTNQAEVYKKIRSFVGENGVDGSSLQHALSKLGWRTLYWNPNPSKNKLWDFQEKIADPKNVKHFRGFHVENYTAAVNKKRYFLNSVDDITSLVGFESTEPALLKSIPFFVGTAHMGYHVFPGAYGIVIEGHSSRAITDEKTIESAPFNPLDNNGAPSGRYRSGLISIPPMSY